MPRILTNYPLPLLVFMALLIFLPIGKFLTTPTLVQLGASSIDLAMVWCVVKRYRIAVYIIAVLYVVNSLANIENALSVSGFSRAVIIHNAVYLSAALYFLSPQMTKFLSANESKT